MLYAYELEQRENVAGQLWFEKNSRETVAVVTALKTCKYSLKFCDLCTLCVRQIHRRYFTKQNNIL